MCDVVLNRWWRGYPGVWGKLDAVAHVLYSPGMLGQRVVRERWYHRIHLIPARLMAYICDRFEARLQTTGTFYETDEDFLAALDAVPYRPGPDRHDFERVERQRAKAKRRLADLRKRAAERRDWMPSVPTAVAREWDNPDDAVYDWADDPNLTLAETMAKFATLEPVDVIAPIDLGEHLTEAERKAEGQRITDEINADPAEVERLRRARQSAREGRRRRFDDAMPPK